MFKIIYLGIILNLLGHFFSFVFVGLKNRVKNCKVFSSRRVFIMLVIIRIPSPLNFLDSWFIFVFFRWHPKNIDRGLLLHGCKYITGYLRYLFYVSGLENRCVKISFLLWSCIVLWRCFDLFDLDTTE